MRNIGAPRLQVTAEQSTGARDSAANAFTDSTQVEAFAMFLLSSIEGLFRHPCEDISRGTKMN